MVHLRAIGLSKPSSTGPVCRFHRMEAKVPTTFSRGMDNYNLFDIHNDALLLFYNINDPVCIFLNLLAIYLIVFKSSWKMRKYRWYFLNYQSYTVGSCHRGYILQMTALVAFECKR
uniref:Transmembrane protein n=1 Tax=Heterorhabditis bacteriophora TaxID=37862 RepID=A0A1I7WSF9_HETBA